MTARLPAGTIGARARPHASRGRGSGGGGTWVEVRVAASAAAAEAVGAVLEDLRTGGLAEERPSASRVVFRCYLPPSRLLAVTLRAVRARIRSLRRYGIDPGAVRVTTRRVASRRWATAWRAHVRPVRVGRLYVRPSWIPGPNPAGTAAVAIDPGMAFGTGMHPSTRLCLRALQTVLPVRRPGPAPVVFDVGTGSGILAIAAIRLGARRVWAVDNDPVAVAVARENVLANGDRARVRVARRTGLTGAPGRADLIVANLIAETIIPLLRDVRRTLRPGGVFIGSGIVADRLPAVLGAARPRGLRRVRVLAEGEWRAVVLGVGRRATSASTRRRRR